MENLGDLAGDVSSFLSSFFYELVSAWLLIQLVLIAIAGFAGTVLARLLKSRVALAELTMGWPAWLRLAVRLIADNLGTIFFILLLVVERSGLLLITPSPARSYLVSVAASLATAWVVIVLLTGVIKNQFVTRIVAVLAWTLAALSIVGLLAPTMAALDSVGIVVGGLRITPLLVIKTTILLLLTLWAANALSDFLERRVQTSADLTPSIQVLLGKVIRLLLLTFAVLIVLSTVGIDFSALAFFSGAIGVGVGFGLQKIVSNLVSGIILLADKSIKPGDVITVGDHFGWVTTMGARYTSVNTRDGREFLVPNEDFITQKVINWSYSSEDIQVELKFGVSYDSDPHKVREFALAACQGVPRVLQTPEPVCHLIGFGDSSLDFCLRFWISDPANGITNVRGLVMLNLWDTFKREGVDIPYPVRDLRMAPAKAPVKSAKRQPARRGR